MALGSPELAGEFFTTCASWEAQLLHHGPMIKEVIDFILKIICITRERRRKELWNLEAKKKKRRRSLKEYREYIHKRGVSQVALVVKNLPAYAGDIRDVGLIPGSGRSPGGGHGNPLQCSCLENHHWQRNLVSYSPWHLDWSEVKWKPLSCVWLFVTPEFSRPKYWSG